MRGDEGKKQQNDVWENKEKNKVPVITGLWTTTTMNLKLQIYILNSIHLERLSLIIRKLDYTFIGR